jgi:hypothetical protein
MTEVVIVGKIFYGDRYPDQGLPPGQGGHPSHPIHYPGQPTHPIYHPGHPDHGLPSQPPGYWGGVAPPHPDQGLPGGQGGTPTHPIHIPGVPDQGLPPPSEIPPEGVTDPDLPEGYDDELVIAVKQPGGDDWTYHAYTVAPDQGQPVPTPQAPRPRR